MAKNIEVDVTWHCNFKCANCSRRCDLLPGEHAEVSLVEKFMRDSLRADYAWSHVFMMGGEPTLHPNFNAIVGILQDYRRQKPRTTINLVTNYHTAETRALTDRADVLARKAVKTGTPIPDPLTGRPAGTPLHKFWTLNVAPVDFEEFLDEDFQSGCMQIKRCGFQLTTDGYFTCAMMGGIERIFRFGLGTSCLEELLDWPTQLAQRAAYCSLCGRFRLKYAIGEASFTGEKLALFREHLKEYPLNSGKRVLSESYQRRLSC